MAKRPSILIVDDEINVTRTLQLVFEGAGYEVVPAYSSAEAMKLLRNGRQFDIVITDLNMEREDIGLDVARRAKRLKPAPVVVVCTGFASVNNSRQALEMHVDYLATKPVDLDELKSALSRFMRQRGEKKIRK
jgi:two-component system, NtrC family, nitrogen regulation response regulator NtrX